MPIQQLYRHADWRGRLTTYLSQTAMRPFRPGRNDCALFVAGAIEAMTGEDLARGWRGYRTLSEGRGTIADAGFEDHVALVADLLPEVAPAFAQVGDVAVLPGDEATALGVVQGENVFCLAPQGMVLVSRLEIQRAFRV